MSANCPDFNRREWIQRLLQTTAGLGIAGLALAADEWHPLFFTPEQNETLVVLGECILPGSRAALGNRIIDAILAIDSEKNREDMRKALRAFDEESRREFGESFQHLDSGKQIRLLTGAANSADSLGYHFGLIKEWMADVYWSSREGLHELGWTGRMAWETFDGCPHPGTHS